MHIAVLSDPENFHTQKWSLALRRAGMRVTIFSFSDYEYAAVPCVKIQPRFTINGQLTYASFLFSADRLREALLEHQVDIINPINATPYGVWAARTDLNPIACIAMGADILEFPPKRSHSTIPKERHWGSKSATKQSLLWQLTHSIKWHIFRSQVKNALEKANFITGDNLELVRAVSEWFDIPAEKVHLNRWGIEEELFEVSQKRKEELRQKYHIKAGQKVVLSPRGMKPIYQGDIILNSFEHLLESGRHDTQFIMLSAGYEIPPALHQKAMQLTEKYECFTYVPEILPREEVCQLWSLIDVFISAPVYDGYSNALSEGRYMGVVPIVNAIPGNIELITHGENGWIVDPFNENQLSQSLEYILNRLPEIKQQFAVANREWILSNAHLKTNIKKFIELCRQFVIEQPAIQQVRGR